MLFYLLHCSERRKEHTSDLFTNHCVCVPLKEDSSDVRDFFLSLCLPIFLLVPHYLSITFSSYNERWVRQMAVKLLSLLHTGNFLYLSPY